MAPNEGLSEEFTDVIPSEEIIQYIHPSFLHLDYDSTNVKVTIMLVTFTAYILQFFLTLFLCNKLNAFSFLSLKHRVFMCLAVSRGIFGISCIIFGTYALFRHTNLDRDLVWGKTATAHMAMTYTVAFFIFELAAVILSDVIFKSFSKLLLIHHSLALSSYGLALVYSTNYSFGCRGLILEMSTPFSCLCFVLMKAGMERSFLWRANQLVLIHTFHLRSVFECYMLYVIYSNWEYIWNTMPMPMFFVLSSGLLTSTFVLTPYWGYKKTQQLFNPVDWNFQESRDASSKLVNDQAKKAC